MYIGPAEPRTELRTAHELFADLAMEAFAERASIELEATGEHARRRRVDTLGDLTPQEAQISRLAAEGHTNREIASQLFISPSTVEYHLRKLFRKLGVKCGRSSRTACGARNQQHTDRPAANAQRRRAGRCSL